MFGYVLDYMMFCCFVILGYLYSKDKRFDKLKLRVDLRMLNEGSGSMF